VNPVLLKTSRLPEQTTLPNGGYPMHSSAHPGDPQSPKAVSLLRRSLPWLLLTLKIGVSAGLLILLLTRIDITAFFARFHNLNWGWLAAGVALLQAQGLISTLKWKLLLKADAQPTGYFFLWKAYAIGMFLSLFLPTSFGGDAYRIWVLSRAGIKASKGAASVLFDRLSGLFALVTIGMIGALILVDQRYIFPILAVYAAAVFTFVVATADGTLARLPQPTSKYLGFPFRVLRSFNHYRRNPRILFYVVALSFLFQANVVVIITCYGRALHIDSAAVSFLEFVAVVPVVFLCEALPISINGIGVRESAFVFFLSRVGTTPEQALALSLLVIAIRYIKGLVGGVLLLNEVFRRGAKVRPFRTSPHAEFGR
jgi:uncharacterized protein (TIRG00374 family)